MGFVGGNDTKVAIESIDKGMKDSACEVEGVFTLDESLQLVWIKYYIQIKIFRYIIVPVAKANYQTSINHYFSLYYKEEKGLGCC